MTRTVYLRDRAQAEAALAANDLAVDNGAAGDIRFLTPPDGAFTAGESYYRAVLAALPRPVEAILDCGDDGACAVEALNAGWRAVVLAGPTRPAVTAIAAELGAEVLARAPAAIDLPSPPRP
jgi:hypothetical protein